MEENKKRKPVVIIEVSSSEEKKEHVDDSANKMRKKTRCGENSRTRVDSRNCHQCKRNDKDKVVCCSRCKAKRFCIHCITRWYYAMLEEAFLEACVVCRDVCNCIECLQLNGRVKNFQIQMLLYTKQNRGGKHIYCNYCSAFIDDFHRSCSSCSYKPYHACCKELRNDNLPADASSELRMQYIDSGEGCSTTLAKNGISVGATEVETRDQTEVAMASHWKPTENGAIPCPPKGMGGYGEGILSLRCLFSENWIFELLQKSKGIAQKCNLNEIRIDPKPHCSCSKSKVESNTSDGKLCKAAAQDNSEDNFLYHPAATEAQYENSRRFWLSLSKGEPVIVTNVHKNALGLSW